MTAGVDISKSAPLTPKSDRLGCEINVCCPHWFDVGEQYKVSNPSAQAKDLAFAGEDLNFLARVLFAEASGSASVRDGKVRQREKQAIIHVLYNRLNVAGFDPNNWTKGRFSTFKAVASAVKRSSGGALSGVQFESVIGTDGSGTEKFKSTQQDHIEHLRRADCLDFDECFEAIRVFLSTGPQADFNFDNFRAAGRGAAPSGQIVIGGNRFWRMGK